MSLKSKGRGQLTSMLCLCPNSAWVVLDQCCIGWINTAVSIHCDSFERKQGGCSWNNTSIQKPARKPLFYEAETVSLPCRAPLSMPLRMIQKLGSTAARFLVYVVRVMQRLWRFNGKCVCAWGYDIPEPVITVSWGKLHVSIELVFVESAVCNPKAAQAEMCRKCKLKIGFRQLLQRATQLKLFLQYSPVAAPWKFTHTLHMGTWLLVLAKKSQKCWKWELIDAARY